LNNERTFIIVRIDNMYSSYISLLLIVIILLHLISM